MKWNKEIITKSRFGIWLGDLAKKSAVAKFIVGTIIWLIALVPTWFYFFVRWLIEPADFWQEVVIFMCAMMVIGWLQAILAIIACALTIALIMDGEW